MTTTADSQTTAEAIQPLEISREQAAAVIGKLLGQKLDERATWLIRGQEHNPTSKVVGLRFEGFRHPGCATDGRPAQDMVARLKALGYYVVDAAAKNRPVGNETDSIVILPDDLFIEAKPQDLEDDTVAGVQQAGPAATAVVESAA